MSKAAETIKNNILDNIINLDKQEGSYVSDIVTPISIEMSELWRECDTITSMVFINGLSGNYLDSKASEYGLTRKYETVDGETVGETDEELRIRLIRQISSPSSSGNKSDYIKWCTEIAGISNARVIPIWNGNGTVKILPVTTEKKAPAVSKITEITNNIEANRPVGATVSVVAPTEKVINITATVVLTPNADLTVAKQKYTALATAYIQNSVFKLSNVDYNKLLSLFYEMEEIQSVTTCKINNGTVNIAIANTEIQVIGTITITGASS